MITILLTVTLILSFTTSYAADHLLEKTFTHDNTYYRTENASIEIEIRSIDQYTSMDDSEYGEFVVSKRKGKSDIIPMNNEDIGRYSFIKGSTPECTKALNLP